MQVGTGRMPALADIPDHLPLGHALAFLHCGGDAGKMGVASVVPVRVRDLHHMAVAITPAGKAHRPPSDGDDRSPMSGRIVDGEVRPYSAENRMGSIQAKIGRDP